MPNSVTNTNTIANDNYIPVSTMKDFLAWAPTLQAPLADSPQKPPTDSLQTAISWRSKQTHEQIYAKREDLLDELIGASIALQQQWEEWRNSLPDDIRELHGHIHRPLIRYLMDRIGFVDQEYLDGLDQGFPLCGHISPSGHGVPSGSTSDTKPIKQLLKEAKAQRARGDTPTAKKYLRELWDNIAEEKKKGWWTPWQKMSCIEGTMHLTSTLARTKETRSEASWPQTMI
jgi:hypothetical protein